MTSTSSGRRTRARSGMLPVLAALVALGPALAVAPGAGAATVSPADHGPSHDGSGSGDRREDGEDADADRNRPHTDRERCEPGEPCLVTPAAGEDTAFRVRATRGTTPTTLVATLNGGDRPDCAGYRERSDDWVLFKFTGGGGATWAKTVTMTAREATSRAEARNASHRRQVCFAAPYRFTPRDGFRLTRDDGAYLGVLPNCRSGVVRPCLADRTVVRRGDGWVPRLVFRVPPNAQDPRGRS